MKDGGENGRPKHSPLGASGVTLCDHIWLDHPRFPVMACVCGGVRRKSGRLPKMRSDRDGYLLFDLDWEGHRKTVKVHRIVIACFYGEDPREVDHINRCRWDNAATNLRYATSSENKRNVGVRSHSTSQVRCVRWRKDRECWQAYTVQGKKFRSLGHFADLASAKEIAEKYYGAP